MNLNEIVCEKIIYTDLTGQHVNFTKIDNNIEILVGTFSFECKNIMGTVNSNKAFSVISYGFMFNNNFPILKWKSETLDNVLILGKNLEDSFENFLNIKILNNSIITNNNIYFKQ